MPQAINSKVYFRKTVLSMSENNDIRFTVAKNIYFLRTSADMTQLELGEKLNYTDKTISKWEQGRALPDIIALKQMSDIFSVPSDYILNNHENDPTPFVPSHQRKHNQLFISIISVLSVMVVALILYLIFLILGNSYWQIFIYAFPVSMIVALVLNSVWGGRKANFVFISLLIWSLLFSLIVLIPGNQWLLLTLGVPAEIILFFSFKIKKGK